MLKFLVLALCSVVPPQTDIPDVYFDVASLVTIDDGNEQGDIYHKLVLKDWIPKEETHVIVCSRPMSDPDNLQRGWGIHRDFHYNHMLKRYEMIIKDPLHDEVSVRLIVKSVVAEYSDTDPDPEFCYECWQYHGYDGGEPPYKDYRYDKIYTIWSEHKRKLDAKLFGRKK